MRQECCARVRIKILQLLYDRLSSTETDGGTLGDELQSQTALTPTHGLSIVGREVRPDDHLLVVKDLVMTESLAFHGTEPNPKP